MLIETAVALIAAHLVADFVLQTNYIITNKKRPMVMLLHILIVAASAAALTGNPWHPAILILVLTHLALDFWKIQIGGDGFRPFVIDQLGHLGVIVLIAGIWPSLFRDGIWATPPSWTPIRFPESNLDIYLQGLTLFTGYWAAVVVGGYGIKKFVAELGYQEDPSNAGLQDGGKYIGWFERSLVFVLTLVGQIEAVGFLVAAKSLLRMNATANERKTSEYIIIGTLLSFGWALIVALVTQYTLHELSLINAAK